MPPFMDPNDPDKLEASINSLGDGDLSEDDFRSESMEELKKSFELEMSLPSQRVNPVEWRELLSTLQATKEQTVQLRENLADARSTFGTIPIGIPQRYSSEPFEKLSRIFIRDLLLRKVHKGQYLLCRTVCPVVLDFGTHVLMAVDDPQGAVVAYVKIQHHSLMRDASWDELESIIIPVGTMMAIREPMYVGGPFSGPANLPFVKVDSPSDIVFLNAGHPAVQGRWMNGLALSPVHLRPPTSGQAWKALGLKSFKAGRWFAAAMCYTKCIEEGYEVNVARLNRAEAYLRLRWNNSAYHDAKTAIDAGTVSEDLKRKGIVRMLKAQYALGQYDDLLETAKLRPEDPVVAEWEAKAKQRKDEQTTGKYDWKRLWDEGSAGGYSADIGDYTGPIRLGFRDGPNSLRGVFATRDIKVGELLIFHKPLSYAYFTGEENEPELKIDYLPTSRTCTPRTAYRHFTNVLHDVWDDRNKYGMIRFLHGGSASKEPCTLEFKPSSEKQFITDPRRPAFDIDVDDVFLTVILNSFGFGDEGKPEGRGLYGLASLFNHSCGPSAHRNFIGNAMLIRASRDIKKDEEITLAYLTVAGYDERRYRLMRTWLFNCHCEFCLIDKMDNIDVRKKRRALLLKIEKLVASSKETKVPTRLKQLEVEGKKCVDEMRTTYSPNRSSPLKLELSQAIGHYASLIETMKESTRNTPTSCMERLALIFEALELQGFRVVDRSTSGRVERKFPADLCEMPRLFNECAHLLSSVFILFKALGDKNRANNWLEVIIKLVDLFYGPDSKGARGFKTCFL